MKYLIFNVNDMARAKSGKLLFLQVKCNRNKDGDL